jgi:hypothetical protein
MEALAVVRAESARRAAALKEATEELAERNAALRVARQREAQLLAQVRQGDELSRQAAQQSERAVLSRAHALAALEGELRRAREALDMSQSECERLAAQLADARGSMRERVLEMDRANAAQRFPLTFAAHAPAGKAAASPGQAAASQYSKFPGSPAAAAHGQQHAHALFQGGDSVYAGSPAAHGSGAGGGYTDRYGGAGIGGGGGAREQPRWPSTPASGGMQQQQQQQRQAQSPARGYATPVAAAAAAAARPASTGRNRAQGTATPAAGGGDRPFGATTADRKHYHNAIPCRRVCLRLRRPSSNACARQSRQSAPARGGIARCPQIDRTRSLE